MTVSNSRSDAPAALGRVRLAGVAAALAAALLLLLTPAGERARNALVDAWQRLSPRDLTHLRARVVEIDAESLRLFGPWPWSRDDMARLTERLGDMRAAAIGFDMVFPEPDRQSPALFARRYRLDPVTRDAVLALPSLDDEFARALGRYPTVLARAGLDESSTEFAERTYQDPGALPVDAVFTAPLPPGVAAWPQALSSIPEIEETSFGHGLINGAPDRDGIVRRIPAVGRIATTANTGFALEIARVMLAAEAVTPVVADGALRGVRLGGRTIPTAPDGRFALRFGRMPPGSVISAADIFRRGFDARRIAGRAVVIGLGGAGSTDIVSTPLEPQALGTRVQAQAIDAILTGQWLDRPRWALAAEAALGALLAALVILFFPRRGSRGGAVIAVAALALVPAGWLAFARAGLLLDPVTPLGIGGAAAAAVLAGLAVLNARERRALEAALLHEQLAAARAAGEMEAARDIQLGMLPPPGALTALDSRLDIAALLEPAREVGGDFYDAFALPGGRTAFLIADVTGKGVPAALFMALAKALTRSALERRPDDLASAIALLNADLSRDNAEAMHVTLLIGVLGPDGTGALVNAGHENPLLLRAGGGVEELPLTGGPPICVVDDYPYEAEPLSLAPGDGLVFVTDGVTEAQNAAGDFFDRERVEAALAALPPEWRAGDAAAALVDAVRTFEASAEASDDLTVVVLREAG